MPRDGAAGFSIEDAVGQTGSSDIGVTIRPRFGIAIPIVLRIGETTLQTGIRDARVLTAQDGTQAIAFTLTRAGTRSAFGDIVVSARGAERPVAIARGIGVYPEVDQRAVIVPIDPATAPRLLAPGAQLTISYTDDDFEPGARLAQHSFIVP